MEYRAELHLGRPHPYSQTMTGVVVTLSGKHTSLLYYEINNAQKMFYSVHKLKNIVKPYFVYHSLSSLIIWKQGLEPTIETTLG